MPPKRIQIQSTSSHMESHQVSLDSPNDELFVHDEGEEHQLDTLFPVETPRVSSTKRQYWTVQVRNSEGEVKERPMKINDIWFLPVDEKVIIPFDRFQPSGTEADGLLGGFLGRLAQDHKNFPISFRKWPMVPAYYKEYVWSSIIKVNFWWDPIHEEAVKAYIMKDISKKWRDNRKRLFDKYYDSTKTREENIRVPPLTIPAVEWANFIDYRLEEGTKEMCRKNAQNRANLKIHHTCGSKKLKRKSAEIARETGKEPSRGTVFIETRKRHNGNYISEEARLVCEKIAEIESQGTAPVAISPNDSLGQVFGKEHPGRVRGVGSGVCPSQLFGSSYQRFSGTPSTSNTSEQTVHQLQNEIQDLRTEMKSKDETIMEIQTEMKSKDETIVEMGDTIMQMKEVLAQLLTKNSMPVPSHLAPKPN